MKTLQRCDANHANRCHSARCGVTSFLLRSAPMRIEALVLLDVVACKDSSFGDAPITAI